jgi:hypothetical protein
MPIVGKALHVSTRVALSKVTAKAIEQSSVNELLGAVVRKLRDTSHP